MLLPLSINPDTSAPTLAKCSHPYQSIQKQALPPSRNVPTLINQSRYKRFYPCEMFPPLSINLDANAPTLAKCSYHFQYRSKRSDRCDKSSPSPIRDPSAPTLVKCPTLTNQSPASHTLIKCSDHWEISSNVSDGYSKSQKRNNGGHPRITVKTQTWFTGCG